MMVHQIMNSKAKLDKLARSDSIKNKQNSHQKMTSFNPQCNIQCSKIDKIESQQESLPLQKLYQSIIKPFSNSIQLQTICIEEFLRIYKIFTEKKTLKVELPRSNPVDTLTYRSYCTLKPSTCINDEVINTYISLINSNFKLNDFVIMNTFFCVTLKNKGAERLAKIYNLSKNKKLIIPIHYNGNHWFFVFINNGVIKIYDSLKNKGVCPQILEIARHIFGQYEIEVAEFPRQSGVFDCGIFMLCGIKAIIQSENDSLTWKFSKENIDYHRLIIAKNIIFGNIRNTSKYE